MAGHAAVRVDDDLAAGQAGVAHGPADDEPAGGVDVDDRIGLARSSAGMIGMITDSMMSDRSFSISDVGVVLGRDDDVGDSLRDAVVVLDGDLGLAVGAKVRQLAALANLGQPARQAMGQGDRQRHQLGRLAAGEPDHHALVAGAELVLRGRLAVPGLHGIVHALGDVGRLLLDADTSVPQVS